MSRRSPLLSTGVMGYAEMGKTPIVSPPSGKQLKVYSISTLNRSGAAADLGLALKFPNAAWEIGSIVAASTPDFLTKTAAIQAGTATVMLTVTNNDGYLIQCKHPFNVVGITVSEAATGGTFTYEYYNGSAYTTLTTIAVPTYSATGDKYLTFGIPVDWAVGTTAAVGGSTSLYSILVRHTTAPGDTGSFNAAWVGRFLTFRSQVANNSSLSLGFDELNPYVLESGESIIPYFGTASANNCTEAFYAIAD